MKFTAKPLVIYSPVKIKFSADKPHRWLRALPMWFQEEYKAGRIQVTNSAAASYITVYSGPNTTRALEGDWIIKNEAGRIFAMPDQEFRDSFTPD